MWMGDWPGRWRPRSTSWRRWATTNRWPSTWRISASLAVGGIRRSRKARRRWRRTIRPWPLWFRQAAALRQRSSDGSAGRLSGASNQAQPAGGLSGNMGIATGREGSGQRVRRRPLADELVGYAEHQAEPAGGCRDVEDLRCRGAETGNRVEPQDDVTDVLARLEAGEGRARLELDGSAVDAEAY